MGINETAQTDDHRADRRPPHPVEWQAVEEILDAVKGGGEQCCFKADNEADPAGSEQRPACLWDDGCHREHRSRSEQQRAPGKGNEGCDEHGDEAARFPFEQEHFDGQ